MWSRQHQKERRGVLSLQNSQAPWKVYRRPQTESYPSAFVQNHSLKFLMSISWHLMHLKMIWNVSMPTFTKRLVRAVLRKDSACAKPFTGIEKRCRRQLCYDFKVNSLYWEPYKDCEVSLDNLVSLRLCSLSNNGSSQSISTWENGRQGINLGSGNCPIISWRTEALNLAHGTHLYILDRTALRADRIQHFFPKGEFKVFGLHAYREHVSDRLKDVRLESLGKGAEYVQATWTGTSDPRHE